MPFRLDWWCLRHVPQYAWRFYILDYSYLWASLVIQMVKSSPAMQETRFNPWVEKIPWRRKWLSTPVFLPGEFHGQKSLEGSQRVGHDWSDLARTHLIFLLWCSLAHTPPLCYYWEIDCISICFWPNNTIIYICFIKLFLKLVFKKEKKEEKCFYSIFHNYIYVVGAFCFFI